jgi:hypothetical protein
MDSRGLEPLPQTVETQLLSSTDNGTCKNVIAVDTSLAQPEPFHHTTHVAAIYMQQWCMSSAGAAKSQSEHAAVIRQAKTSLATTSHSAHQTLLNSTCQVPVWWQGSARGTTCPTLCIHIITLKQGPVLTRDLRRTQQPHDESWNAQVRSSPAP